MNANYFLNFIFVAVVCETQFCYVILQNKQIFTKKKSLNQGHTYVQQVALELLD